MLALSEFTRYALLAACLGLAAAALGPLPHLVLGGLLLLGSGGIALWLWSPGALTDAYQHLSLSLKGQSRFLLHLRCVRLWEYGFGWAGQLTKSAWKSLVAAAGWLSTTHNQPGLATEALCCFFLSYLLSVFAAALRAVASG